MIEIDSNGDKKKNPRHCKKIMYEAVQGLPVQGESMGAKARLQG